VFLAVLKAVRTPEELNDGNLVELQT